MGCYTMRFMFNEDNNHFIFSRKSAGERVTKTELEAFILQYQGTQITDFLFNVNCRTSAVPSTVLDSVIDMYENARRAGRLEEHLGGVDIAYNLFVTQGIDMYQVWIETARRIGIRPWLSFRMNDRHDSFSKDDTINGDFYYSHPEYRRAVYRRQVSAEDCCYDYAHAEIRDRMKRFIAEMLERYDVDGIELDFSREVYCFAPGREEANIITKLLEEIKGITEKAADRYGHSVLISVTMPPRPETALSMGFAVLDWMKKGLVDIIVPISRWATIDNDIPVGMWKEWLYPFEPEIIAGHQILLRSCIEAPVSINSFETAVGSAANYYSMGSDGVYLYNYMDRIEPFLCESTGLKTDLGDPDVLHRLFCTIGDKEKVMRTTRRHIVTFPDALGYWERGNAVLPIFCHQNDYYFSLRVGVGTIIEGAKTFVILAIESADESFSSEDIEVYLSGYLCTFAAYCEIATHCSTKKGYMFSVPADAKIGEYGVIEFTSINKKPFETDYAEIYIIND